MGPELPTRRRDPRTGERYYQHRAMAAWKLGRPLNDAEVVHHLNGDPHDNHPDNLQVFPNRRAHMLYLHYRWREQGGVRHLFSIQDLLAAEGSPSG
jgi:hypothetical protein